MILVSACLVGVDCKYSGGNNRNEAVLRWLRGKDYVLICPETEGGLTTPRAPSECREDRVVNARGEDVTAFFQKGAEMALLRAKENGADLAILKARSPSCGCDGIYDGSFTGKLIPGMGVTARLLKAAGLRLATEKDVEKLMEDGTETT